MAGGADLIAPALAGFGLGGGLIIAIGAQNALVLAHGLRRQHVLLLTTMGFLADAFLIALGVAGVGTLVATTPWLTRLAAWGGAAFLLVYGAIAFRKALDPGRLVGRDGERGQGWRRAAAAMLAVTFLNPHVYLDTVVLVGSIAGQYPFAERWAFGGGAMTASAVWFYGLGYGAALLAPIFARPLAWRILDIAIGVVMWAIAVSLIVGAAG